MLAINLHFLANFVISFFLLFFQQICNIMNASEDEFFNFQVRWSQLVFFFFFLVFFGETINFSVTTKI